VNALRIAKVHWIGSTAVFGAGAAMLFLYAKSEVAANPGIALVDGYWIGRLPWTPIGVGLVIGGATATLLLASVVVMIAGHWVLRVLALPGLLAAAFWYSISLVFGLPGASGGCCGQPVKPDLITIAYSAPMNPIIFVLLPAAIASVLAVMALVLRQAAPQQSAVSA
jgi:hypothetical protein